MKRILQTSFKTLSRSTRLPSSAFNKRTHAQHNHLLHNGHTRALINLRKRHFGNLSPAHGGHIIEHLGRIPKISNDGKLIS